jgi:hypothetical protein
MMMVVMMMMMMNDDDDDGDDDDDDDGHLSLGGDGAGVREPARHLTTLDPVRQHLNTNTTAGTTFSVIKHPQLH